VIVTGVLIFSEIAIAGCGFLLYFLCALWRESRATKARAQVRMSRIVPRSNDRKLLHFQNPEYAGIREKVKRKV
jgi:threonine/homoserine/homoserine lactone efflux protein